MYFVDREKIEEQLSYIEKQIGIFTELKECETIIEKLAVERIVHMVIEAVLDVGNSMIDGFIMRDPGSYEDILDILEDEKVITAEMCESYKRIIMLRKSLLQFYTNINHEELFEVFQTELTVLKHFAPNVREYIENELGPVTTFKP
ncbi:DUF86 domain-containing protein [Bacillus benzoevorans]|uniref:Uncharacterized protein YutE (UPF0331/DUF86 family) n=1 Tax=Bacillus benzoevorans TaxID=1456 RepID=A0A7X0LUI9_9BACI|nr:DUF86 domain-containing protein [Bacillus benzoevorans]MBB6445016.1 uncharacterized protein YutE (UPF0331/DUF86 family) [Bacillus benzoevorans]